MANITVTVYDSTENKRVPVELPDDAPANRIIAVLVDKLQLPQNGPDGAPLSYKFHHKNSGRQIQDAQTLADAAVKDGDILRLQPEITAGSGSVWYINSSLRDARLPEGPRLASESLDADTASGSVFKLTHYPGAR